MGLMYSGRTSWVQVGANSRLPEKLSEPSLSEYERGIHEKKEEWDDVSNIYAGIFEKIHEPTREEIGRRKGRGQKKMRECKEKKGYSRTHLCSGQ